MSVLVGGGVVGCLQPLQQQGVDKQLDHMVERQGESSVRILPEETGPDIYAVGKGLLAAAENDGCAALGGQSQETRGEPGPEQERQV